MNRTHAKKHTLQPNSNTHLVLKDSHNHILCLWIQTWETSRKLDYIWRSEIDWFIVSCVTVMLLCRCVRLCVCMCLHIYTSPQKPPCTLFCLARNRDVPLFYWTHASGLCLNNFGLWIPIQQDTMQSLFMISLSYRLVQIQRGKKLVTHRKVFVCS